VSSVYSKVRTPTTFKEIVPEVLQQRCVTHPRRLKRRTLMDATFKAMTTVVVFFSVLCFCVLLCAGVAEDRAEQVELAVEVELDDERARL
jgi:hypothetical protein